MRLANPRWASPQTSACKEPVHCLRELHRDTKGVLVESKRQPIRRPEMGDCRSLERVFCDPAMTRYLGGAWTASKVAEALQEWRQDWGVDRRWHGILQRKDTLQASGTRAAAGASVRHARPCGRTSRAISWEYTDLGLTPPGTLRPVVLPLDRPSQSDRHHHADDHAELMLGGRRGRRRRGRRGRAGARRPTRRRTPLPAQAAGAAPRSRRCGRR